MANTLVLLEKITVNAGVSSVTFSNIPQTGYNDLILKMSLRDDTNSGSYQQLSYRFNGSTANYSTRAVYADGATPGSGTTTTNTPTIGGTWGRLTSYGINQPNTTASTFTSFEWTIPNYTVSQYKSFSCDYVTENNGTTAYQEMIAGLWSDTSAINSIAITPYSGNFAQYSTLSLYGVSNVNTTPTVAPKATGGDIIKTDGTYWYHAFLNTGSFIPATTLNCDLLVVAGGGGGGSNGAGGGAGGLVGYTAQLFGTGISQTVTVGAGGAANVGSGTYKSGGNGTNSSFGSLTASVGGGGGSGADGNNGNGTGNSGGSGGGGGWGIVNTLTGGAGTSGQGYAGGTGSGGAAGGGGGANAIGANNSSNTGGAGGAGSSAYSSWGSATSTGQLVSSTYYYAGGGGGGGLSAGGAGGNGGGGNGNGGTSGVPGFPATANTGGGGGGGGGTNSSGAAGGSGIVIVRYTVI